MSLDPSFAEFIRRIRAGDAHAAVELVTQYEAAIRFEVRMRLRDPRLRRTFDSTDVCQSVMASFFVRAAAGQFDLEEPEQLIRLLVGMARKKVAFAARKQYAQRRDTRRNQTVDAAGVEPAALEPTPSSFVAHQEMLAEFQRRLTGEERLLAELRNQGRSWQEIADRLGGTALARRKQMSRAANRVASELGLDEVNDG